MGYGGGYGGGGVSSTLWYILLDTAHVWARQFSHLFSSSWVQFTPVWRRLRWWLWKRRREFNPLTHSSWNSQCLNETILTSLFLLFVISLQSTSVWWMVDTEAEAWVYLETNHSHNESVMFANFLFFCFLNSNSMGAGESSKVGVGFSLTRWCLPYKQEEIDSNTFWYYLRDQCSWTHAIITHETDLWYQGLFDLVRRKH